MDYTITSCYRWFTIAKTEKEIVKVFYIESFPFTYERLPEITRNDPEVITQANEKIAIRSEQMARWSDYLMAEQAHPFFFNLNIKNPEELPVK
jgi:hypothetical protein